MPTHTVEMFHFCCAGGEIASTFDSPDKLKLGSCKLIEEIMIGEDKLIHFSGVEMGEACTIVLRGASKHLPCFVCCSRFSFFVGWSLSNTCICLASFAASVGLAGFCVEGRPGVFIFFCLQGITILRGASKCLLCPFCCIRIASSAG